MSEVRFITISLFVIITLALMILFSSTTVGVLWAMIHANSLVGFQGADREECRSGSVVACRPSRPEVSPVDHHPGFECTAAADGAPQGVALLEALLKPAPLDVRPGLHDAEIHGIDLSQPLDDATWSAILEAFHDHLVIFFRDQSLTSGQQLEFARSILSFTESKAIPSSSRSQRCPMRS